MLTVRTANATVDDKSDRDYRDMYEDLRDDRSLRGFVKYIDSAMSHATWDKYDKDPSALTRRMKNELRKAVGLPLLPPTIEEAMHDVSPDATVLVLDESPGPLDQVVVGNRDDKRWQRLLQSAPPHPRPVRPRVSRPVASLDQDARRERLGAAWKEVIEAGLAALEQSLR